MLDHESLLLDLAASRAREIYERESLTRAILTQKSMHCYAAVVTNRILVPSPCLMVKLNLRQS